MGEQSRAEYFRERGASADDGGAGARPRATAEDFGCAATLSADERERGIAFADRGVVSRGWRGKCAGDLRRVGGELRLDVVADRAGRRSSFHDAELHADR